jgi:hypothetical protein
MAPELVAVLSAQQVIRHVNQTSSGSPFVSCTGKAAIARAYATMYGSRPEGVHIATKVSAAASTRTSGS